MQVVVRSIADSLRRCSEAPALGLFVAAWETGCKPAAHQHPGLQLAYLMHAGAARPRCAVGSGGAGSSGHGGGGGSGTSRPGPGCLAGQRPVSPARIDSICPTAYSSPSETSGARTPNGRQSAGLQKPAIAGVLLNRSLPSSVPPRKQALERAAGCAEAGRRRDAAAGSGRGHGSGGSR